MGLNEWLTILGALGGLEAIKWIANYSMNRKSIKKQASAEATHADLTNLNDYADSWKKLYTEAKSEIKELNTKNDTLYVDLKQLRDCKTEHVRNEHRLELENEALKIKKCDVRGCASRLPPSEF